MTEAVTPPWSRADWRCLAALLAVAVGLWLPRLRGPLDLRYDAGVYYILGTSLAEGRGYRLLNEPGAIQAIQYPPLVPAVGALAERVAGYRRPGGGRPLAQAGERAPVRRLCGGRLRHGPPSPRARLRGLLATLLSVVHSHTIFLSDFFAADVPYAFVSTLFFAVGGGRGRRPPRRRVLRRCARPASRCSGPGWRRAPFVGALARRCGAAP